jgi:hypothetical protein
VEHQTVRNQKTYSLPIQIAEWLRKFFEENKEDLALIGITSETKLLEVLARNGEQFVQELLLEVLARNGEQFVQELLDDLKAKRMSRKLPQK